MVCFSIKRMNIPVFLKRQTVAQAALLISLVLFFSKFIGFAREVLVANYFGATGTTDAFLVALIIPTAILGLFSTGLNALIIPVYIEKKAADPFAARRFVNSIFLVSALFFLLVSAIVFAFAPAFVKIIAFGFKGDRLALAVTLTRFLIFSGILTVLTGLLNGILQSEKQFLAPALAAMAGNAVLVLSLFLLHRNLGINSWTAGQIAMAVLNFSLLFFLLFKRYGFFHSLGLRGIDWKEVARFAWLLLPLVAAGGISFLNMIIDKTIGSTLDAGSIAALNFSARIWGIPITLLAIPIATAVFPSFSELAVSDSARSQYSSKLERTLSVSWFFIVPFSVFLFFLSEPLVRLLFERGAFDTNATSLTAAVNKMYVIGLFAHAASPIIARAFYSFKNTLTPLLISAFSVCLNIVLNVTLARLMGAPGIALATTIVMTTNFILFSVFMKKYFILLSKPFITESLKLVLASVPTAAVCVLSQPIFFGAHASTLDGFISLSVRVGTVGLTASLVFLTSCHFLKATSLALARDYISGLLTPILKKMRPMQEE